MSIQPVAVVGVDPHADTLSAAGINSTGNRIWDATVANTPDGIAELIGRANGSGPDWAIEGAGTFGRFLADTLLSTGTTVLEVPTRLTARLRRRGGFAKTDRGDALTIARAGLNETLGPVTHHPVVEALRVLVKQRQSVVDAQTQALNRLRARLRELDPAAVPTTRLRSRKRLSSLAALHHDGPDPYRQALTLAISLDAAACLEHRDRIRLLETQIRRVLPEVGDVLMRIQGIGLVGAATIIAHSAPISRFPTEGHYASYNGTAPLDASSGRQQRHRLNRWGNRTLNKTLHIAIVTQLAQHGDAYRYVSRRITEGKTKTEAIRAAKRHLSRRIYRTLKNNPLT
ncbi:MAG: IS110 family transposase [Acidobacteria bacterium]|nr:IS110 family transposase [Acidobacteriota bacterium]